MKFRRLLLTALLPLAACAPGARAGVLGVYDPDSFVEGDAERFAGCHDGRGFVAGDCARLADTLAAGEELPGVDSAGRPARVRLSRVRAAGQYEAAYVAELVPSGAAAAGPVLFWRPGPPLHALASAPVSLDSAATALLRAEALRLYATAEQQRAPGDRAEAMELGTPLVLGVEGESSLVVQWPAQLAYGTGRDRRASLFFVYDPVQRQVVRGLFGHPEWGPVDPSLVRAVQPVTFFRLGADPAVYFLAREAGPWEHIGFGIYEMSSGRAVLGVP
ncbi:MAG TPA: hypothetical protein VGB24_19040 [Longimicrobium sp.]|jgi:hypothetical protein|uniref:hypothetical protein n=1 Tax=Longimicrobium sp. TaxID=2029185 RepID=UPI002EDB5071